MFFAFTTSWFYSNMGEDMTKAEIGVLAAESLATIRDNKELVPRAFRMAGLYPFDADAVLSTLPRLAAGGSGFLTSDEAPAEPLALHEDATPTTADTDVMLDDSVGSLHAGTDPDADDADKDGDSDGDTNPPSTSAPLASTAIPSQEETAATLLAIRESGGLAAIGAHYRGLAPADRAAVIKAAERTITAAVSNHLWRTTEQSLAHQAAREAKRMTSDKKRRLTKGQEYTSDEAMAEVARLDAEEKATAEAKAEAKRQKLEAKAEKLRVAEAAKLASAKAKEEAAAAKAAAAKAAAAAAAAKKAKLAASKVKEQLRLKAQQKSKARNAAPASAKTGDSGAVHKKLKVRSVAVAAPAAAARSKADKKRRNGAAGDHDDGDIYKKTYKAARR
jgi:hypothetical protein